ncbi:Hypp7614 [Branchiostoma lanceolatum]|uniref:Hypp7614 protein n=1 Tax=Branchiostoma lanceolatum TaxID=7740 RepID=A0A8J9Z1N1_BRALA|nr:Hypp7614 [Branchiostoma lanceolatum]
MSKVNIGDECSQEKFQSGDPVLIRKRAVLSLGTDGKPLTKSPSDTLVEVKPCKKLVDKDSGISVSEMISLDDGCIPPRTVKANHRLTMEGVPAFEFAILDRERKRDSERKKINLRAVKNAYNLD